MINEYQVGRISIETDSDVVTGHGTSWLTYARAGDRIKLGEQVHLISDVLDVAHLKLTSAYTGPTLSQAQYLISK